MLIGPGVGSCGTAAYRGEQVIVSDIASDPLWADYREAALSNSLRACWSTPIFSSEGKVIATFAMYYREPRGPSARDQEIIEQITHLAGIAIQRRLGEEALRESEEQWRAAFENNPTMYFMMDADGTILSVNPFGAEQLGYTVDELVGSPVLNIFYDADRESIRRHAERCLDQLNRSMSWEARKVRKDGTVLWVRETARAVLLKNRPVVLVACEDITERKRAEEQLEKTEQRLRAVIANAPVILFALDRSGVFTLSEGRGLDALGLKPGEVVGQSVFDVHRDAPQVLSNIRRALAGESFTEVGEVNDLVFEIHYIPVLDEGGQVGAVNGVAINITERKRSEALLAGEKRLLEMIATGVSLKEILNALCLIIEEQRSGMLASVLLLNPDGVHLDVVAGPNLPNEWIQQMEKLPIGPCAGSCGTAAYRSSPVIVCDIATDALWDVPEHRASALNTGCAPRGQTQCSLGKEKSLGRFACLSRTAKSDLARPGADRAGDPP